MKSWLSALIFLILIFPAYAEEDEKRGGMKHQLKLTKGLRYTDNPAFDDQGDPRWAALASLEYRMLTETRRKRFEFTIRGDAIESRVARADIRLDYRMRTASAEGRLTAFLRKADGGYLDQFPTENGLRRLVDLSEPGRDIVSFGTSGRIETGIGRMSGLRLSFRALGRRSSGTTVVPITRSRRVEAQFGVVMRPTKRREVAADAGVLRQRFYGAAARTDRHTTASLSVSSQISRRTRLEGSAGWRRIKSDTAGLQIARSGSEWAVALRQERPKVVAEVTADQRQYLSGAVQSVRFRLNSPSEEGAKGPLDWSLWAGAIDVPVQGTDVIYGIEAAMETTDSRLGLVVSRDYLAGLTDGVERVATYARVTYHRRLTERHRLDLWAELAKVGATPAYPARRVAAVEASIATQITPAFSLRTGVTVRNRKGGLTGSARDRSIFITLERLRMAKR